MRIQTQTLECSNAELEQFSYSISHDMRQPLRMIASYLQLIEMSLGSSLDTEQREYFHFATDGAKRLDAMLVGLLEYSRVGRKGEPLVWITSRTVLDDALRFLQPASAEAQAVIRITLLASVATRSPWPAEWRLLLMFMMPFPQIVGTTKAYLRHRQSARFSSGGTIWTTE